MDDKQLDSFFDKVADSYGSEKNKHKITSAGKMGAYRLTREALDTLGYSKVKEEEFLGDLALQKKVFKESLKNNYTALSSNPNFSVDNQEAVAGALVAANDFNMNRAYKVLSNAKAGGPNTKYVEAYLNRFRTGKTLAPEAAEGPSFSDVFGAASDDQYYLNTISGLNNLEREEVTKVEEELKTKYNYSASFLPTPEEMIAQAGDSPYSTVDAFNRRIGQIKTERPDIDLGVASYDDILTRARTRADQVQSQYQNVSKATGFVSGLANLAGSMYGWAKDPINIAVMALAPGGVGAAGIAARAATTAGTEAAIQTYVQPKRTDIGLQGSVAQGAANVVLAAGGGAASELLFKGLGKAYSPLKDQVVDTWTNFINKAPVDAPNLPAEAIEAATQLVEHTKLNPLASNDVLDKMLSEVESAPSLDGKLDFSTHPLNEITDVPLSIKPSDGGVGAEASAAWNDFKLANTTPGKVTNPIDLIAEETAKLKASSAIIKPVDGVPVPAFDPVIDLPRQIDELAKAAPTIDITGAPIPDAVDSFLRSTTIPFEENGKMVDRSLFDIKQTIDEDFKTLETMKKLVDSPDYAQTLASQATEGYVSKTRVKEIEDLLLILKNQPTDPVTKELLEKAHGIYSRRIEKRNQASSMVLTTQKRSGDQFEASLAKGLSVSEALHAFSGTEPYLSVRKGFLGESFEQKHSANKLLYGSMIADVLGPISPKYMGAISEKKVSGEVVGDYWAMVSGKGERSKDPAIRQSAEAIDALFTRGGQDFDKFGGDIVSRKDYLLGLFSNPRKIRAVHADYATAKSTWSKEVQALGIDIAHLKEQLPGLRVDDPKVMDGFLSRIYDGMVSGGLVDIGDFLPKGLRNVANKRKAPRLLRFETPDAWMNYQEKYGQGDLFNVLNNYVDGISRDMAGLQSYGPSPEALKNHLLRTAAEKDPSNAKRFAAELNSDFAYNLNENKMAPYPTLLTIASNARSVMASSSLGSAVIPAVVNDMLGMGQLAKRIRGLPSFGGTGQAFKNLFNPKLKADQVAAAELGFISDVFTNEFRGSLSNMDSAYGSKVFKQTTSGVLKMSGLVRATDSQRTAHMYELGFDLARFANTLDSFDKLPDRTRNWLASAGITKTELGLIKDRGLSNIEYHGHSLSTVDPNKLFLSEDPVDRELAQKLSGLFANLTEGVSPSYNPNAEAMWAKLNESPLGAVVGGTARTFTGYLTGMWRQHMRPSLYLAKDGHMAPLANLVLGGTVLGTLATQLRDITQGKDPAPISGDTVLRGMSTAGTLGIFGDILSSSGSRFGGGFTDRFFPPASMLEKASDLSIGNLGKLLKGKETSFGKDAVRFLQSVTPGQNGWYTGLIMKRYMFDQLREMTDPKADKAFRRQVTDARKKGQDFWWAPGELTPSRGPDLSTATRVVSSDSDRAKLKTESDIKTSLENYRLKQQLKQESK